MAATLRPRRDGIVRVFLIAFAVYAYFMPRWADWNIDSRLDLTHAIVDGGTLRIDKYHWNTWDKAVYQGHYYSDKAPGTAVLGAIVYGAFALARTTPGLGSGIQALERNRAWGVALTLGQEGTQRAPVARGTVLGGCQRAGNVGNAMYIPWAGNNRLAPYPSVQDWALSKYVVTIGVDALISAAFLAFLFWFLAFFVASGAVRWLAVGAYGFATAALPYSTVFYSHQLVAAFLFTAFALVCLRARQLVPGWTAPIAGFLLGLSLFTEYTVALIVAVIAAYALWVLRRTPRCIAAAAATGAVPIVGLLAYNYLCFGGALDTGYSHDFCWSAAQAAGYAGFTSPKSGPLWDLTFGPFRGLFYLSPFLVFCISGALVMARRRLRLEAVICVGAAIGFIVMMSAYWGWNGGQVDGPRYLVPAIPFLAFPTAFWLDVARKWFGARALTLAAIAWSVFATWSLFLGGLLFPLSWLRNPLFQYSLPALGDNQIAPNAGYLLALRGWQSLIPLVALLCMIAVLPPGRLPRPARGRLSPRAAHS
jgi:hypothetical protein